MPDGQVRQICSGDKYTCHTADGSMCAPYDPNKLGDIINMDFDSVEAGTSIPSNTSSLGNNLSTAQRNNFASENPLTSDVVQDLAENSNDNVLKPMAQNLLRGQSGIVGYTDDMTKIENIRDNIVKDAPEVYVNNYNLALAREDDLTDKAMTSKVLKKEGDNIRNNLEEMKQIGINKMRSAEINTYYAREI